MPDIINLNLSELVLNIKDKNSHFNKNNIIEGIQFHPESIATEFGHKILDNFLGLIK